MAELLDLFGKAHTMAVLSEFAYDEVPPRMEYTPTEKAEKLFPAFAHRHRWAIEHEL